MLVQHYKGGLYFIIEENVKHTEEDQVLVVYKNQEGTVYARPQKMFWEDVEYQGKIVSRFTPIIY